MIGGPFRPFCFPVFLDFRMHSCRTLRRFLLVAIVMVFAGCAQRVTLVPVKGLLIVDGKPAANIFVQFMPDSQKENKGPSSQAYTGPNGEFELVTTDNRPGAVPGAHRVILVDPEEERPAQGQVATKKPRIESGFSTAAGALSVTIMEGQLVELNVVQRSSR